MRYPEPIIVFDGHCRLCLASLRFVDKRDRKRRLRYVPFQESAGQLVCEHFGIDREALESFLLLDGGQVHRKSAAWSRILRHLTLPWPWAGSLLAMLPAEFSDAIYDFVGRHRLRWFGRNEACAWPPPADHRMASMDDVREALTTLAPAPGER